MSKKLYFNYGCMNSGKSMRLIAEANNFEEQDIPFVIFKSSLDTRDGENTIHSRALGDKECVDINPEVDIYKTVATMLEVSMATGRPQLKWILVDEAQFLTKKQVDDLAAIVDNFNISVKCYGLRTDFRTHLFEGSKRLFEVADSLEEIKSTCKCDSKTIFNARIDSNGKVITNGEQIQVGGNESYKALCRKCYYEKTGNIRYQNKKDNN